MNFQQLEYIIAVDKLKHFGLAAESCYVTQATLSAMIKKLEEELNVQFFDRSRHPILTTEHGKVIVAKAKELIRHRDELIGLATTQPTQLEGKLTIGIIPTIANSLLPLILPSLLKKNPNLDLSVVEITTEEIISQLELNKIDLGILATPIEDAELDETILYYEPMLVYGKESGKKKYVSGNDISDRKIWLLQEGHCFRNQAMTICNIEEKVAAASNLQFEGNSFETLLNLAESFGGLTLIPELYYLEMPKRKQKLTKPFHKPIPVREVSIVSYRPELKRHTISYLANHIRKIIEPRLSSKDYKNSDLDIIGI